MTNPHGSWIWYELMTPDPQGARAFYQSVVGWTIAEGHGEPPYAMIDAGDGMVGGVLTLDADMIAHGARPMWIGYLGVDDVDRMVAAIAERGGRTLMPARDIDHIGRIAMVVDPQGAPFYLMKPTPPAGNPDATSTVFSPTADRHFGWNELRASDVDAALHFYASLFGWVKSGAMPMGDAGDYVFLSHHDVPIGAVMRATDQPVGWNHVIRVNGIGAAAARVTQNGGKVLHGPHEVPGGDHVVYAVDPQGAAFVIVGNK